MFRIEAPFRAARLTVATACAAFFLAAAGCAETPDAEVRLVSPDTLLAQLSDDALLLDVRSAEEFAGGHVPGATHLPHSEIATRLDELGSDPSRPVIVYCESGRRAQRAEAALLAAGFTDVRHLEGDMRAWREAGRPIER